jgi:hypothetical protein
MVGTRHILGLAIDDAGVVATELSIQAGRTEVHRTGELLWDQQLTADNAKAQGERLRHFLREHGFSAKRAVVGLAAKWVLTKEVDAPPASPEALAGMLSIQAERAFSLNAEDLIFDYCGPTSTSEKSQVLLLGARRKLVNEVKDLAAAAGLQVQSITLSALACSKALSEGGLACWYGLYARPTYCEFWAQMEGSPRFIKHVPLGKNGTPDAYAELLASTVERLVLLSPVPGQHPPYKVTAYDACGWPEGLIDGLGKRLGPQITVSNGRAGLLSKGLGWRDHPDGARAIAATAVAMTGVGAERPPIDFLHPRIGAKKKGVSHKRVAVWGAGIAAACLLGLGVLLVFWHAYAGDVATYEAWLKSNSTEIAAAQEVVDRYKYASSWDSREPRFLECLKELTLAFPEEPYVWAKNLILNENGTGSLGGTTTSEASFYVVLDKMKQNGAFSDVKMNHIRDIGRDSRDKEFAIYFTFRGMK